jgi:hypothetical protein
VAAVLFGITNLGERPAPAASTPVPEPFLSATPAAASTPSVALPPEAVPLQQVIDTPPPTPETRPTLEALLADPGFAVAANEAVGELLKLWGVQYEPSRGEPCAQAEVHGLKCLYQRRGSLGELRRVGWPAVLSLVTEDGREHAVVVSALGYDEAELSVRGDRFKLPLAELSFYWYGDHLLLWRPGDAPGRDLTPGVADDGVRWLRATLAALTGEQPPQESSTLYDSELERRVRAYQRERQLTVDGIVGARTQIAMLADLRLPGTPSLAKGH